ncbi:hypothetical protein ACN47E_001619 [Coniothyrium glycines]
MIRFQKIQKRLRSLHRRQNVTIINHLVQKGQYTGRRTYPAVALEHSQDMFTVSSLVQNSPLLLTQSNHSRRASIIDEHIFCSTSALELWSMPSAVPGVQLAPTIHPIT